MAERIVSPGVFTQENDLSFLPVGVGEIGAAILGRTERGPAFEPVVVRSMGDFELQFGSSTKGTYVPFTVKEYIRSAGAVTIVRVLGLDGYTISNQVFMYASGSTSWNNESTAQLATDKHLLAVLHATADDDDQQCTNIALGVAGGQLKASSSFAFSFATTIANQAFYADGETLLEITSSDGNQQYEFIAVDAPLPSNDINATGNSIVYVQSASAISLAANDGIAETLGNLAAAVSTHGASLGLTTSGIQVASGSHPYTQGDYVLHLVADTAGTAGNSITYKGANITNGTLLGGVDNSGSGDFNNLVGANVDALATFTGFKNTAVSYSLDKTRAAYVPNVVAGMDAGNSIPGVDTGIETFVESSYVYSIFNSQSYGAATYNEGGGYSFTKASASVAAINFTSAETAIAGVNSYTSGKSYKAASTPWVVSQTVNATNSPLFKFHTLSHGNNSNMVCKVSLLAIKKAGSVSGQEYGSFTVVVRKFDDTDNKVVGLESYANCNLDANSPNYVARRIGDKYKYYQTIGTDSKLVVKGDYGNMSKFVRVEAHENCRNGVYSDQLIPFGNEAYVSPFSSGVYGSYPAAALVTSRSLTTDTKTYYGFNFNETVLNNGMNNYLAPLSDDAGIGYNKTFKLETCQVTGSTVGLDASLSSKRFTLAFQGGFDGVNPATPVKIGNDLSSGNSFGLSFTNTNASGYLAYKKALDTVSNPDEIDINLVVLPGILSSNASNIVQKVIDVCEDRGDCFYVFDGVNSISGDSVSTALSQADNYDTNYAAMYYPWIKILDATVNKHLWVPPSVVVPGVIAYNDKVAFPWFAPAGLNRGSLGTVSDVYTRLTHGERDDLYEGKVNPIAVFPGVGVCIWGQKTLQTKPSALDRINVRRLLIKLKKFIASSTRYLVFENNTTATRNRFLNMVNPYMETVQQQQGLYAFKVVMDETNNTPDVVDRNQMKGEIFLQPAKSAEFIIVDFNIMRTGASFEE